MTDWTKKAFVILTVGKQSFQSIREAAPVRYHANFSSHLRR